MKIRRRQVHEEQRREKRSENEFIYLRSWVFVKKSEFFYEPSEYHHKEYRNGRIQTESKII